MFDYNVSLREAMTDMVVAPPYRVRIPRAAIDACQAYAALRGMQRVCDSESSQDVAMRRDTRSADACAQRQAGRRCFSEFRYCLPLPLHAFAAALLATACRAARAVTPCAFARLLRRLLPARSQLLRVMPCHVRLSSLRCQRAAV